MYTNSIEKKLNSYLKTALIAGTIISILFISSIIIILLKYDRLIWLGDFNTSLFGAIGDFIGGVIGTIFTIIATFLIWLTYNSQKAELAQTRILVERQLEATHLPHFTIKKHIETYTDSSHMIFSDHNYGQYGYFNIELINIGNEPAKEVTLEWDYFDSFDRRKNIISLLDQLPKKGTNRYFTNLDYLESYRENDAKYYNQSHREYDYILPITIKEETIQNLNISVPYKLAMIFHELDTFLVKNLEKESQLDALGYVRISYKNSLNSLLKQEFKLSCFFHEELVQGELRQWLQLRAIETPIKLTP